MTGTDVGQGSRAHDVFGLAGRVAVVAGGGGAIGAAIATRLLEAGARVFCVDLPGHDGPPGTTTIAGDLTAPQDIEAALARVNEAAGRLDIAVHAAGMSRDARLWKVNDDDWRAVMAANLDSAFHLVRAVVPPLRLAGGGAIVLVSSINGERGKVGLAAYSAAKAGVNALARTAAREVGAFGIRVNAIAPGWIDTPMTSGLPAEVRRRALDETVLGRLGEPDDVARVALFLASDLSRHVTGQVIRADGGQLIA